MDEERFEEMARDPYFISGIYNYCDRWCERCAFTARCMNYALGQEEELDRLASKDRDNQAFWDKLDESLADAMEMGEIEETDFDLDEEELQECMREQEEVREAAQSQPYSRTARRYIETVDNWFDSYGCLLEDKPDKSGVPNSPTDDTACIHDCLEVIRWYQRQIWGKLCRAATGIIRTESQEIECMQDDADGSAKVAIIGIERSLAAWATLLRRFPDHEDAIFSLGTLKRLLRQIEAAFPNARAFHRPGFDAAEDTD